MSVAIGVRIRLVCSSNGRLSSAHEPRASYGLISATSMDCAWRLQVAIFSRLAKCRLAASIARSFDLAE